MKQSGPVEVGDRMYLLGVGSVTVTAVDESGTATEAEPDTGGSDHG